MEDPDSAALVLIADDNPINLDLLLGALTPEGLQVAVALDGHQVLEIVAESEPDLILLDGLMPNLDGFETCKRLKMNPATAHIPVIFMTSLTDMEYRLAGFEVGAVDYVTKPFERVELLARVRAQLSLRRATQDLKLQNVQLEKEIQERAAAQQALTEVVRQLEHRTAELHEAQVRLVRLERHTTEIRMAGGFAHEMRNALASAKLRIAAVHKRDGEEEASVLTDNVDSMKDLIVLSQSDMSSGGFQQARKLIRSILDVEKKVSMVLTGISRDIDRALNVTSRILDYSRQGFESPGQEPIDFNKLIGSVVHGIQQSLIENAISLRTEIDADCALQGTESHFFSILNNLVVNARDALLTTSGERIIGIKLQREKASILLQVADTGVGIAPENHAKIFEPFFSMKPNTGTGLGLNMVDRLVLLYRGTIDVDSAPGRGTIISIRIPTT